MATTTKDEKKLIDHNINLGAALVLKAALEGSGWYKGLKPSKFSTLSDLLENPPLCDVKVIEPLDGESQKEYDKRAEPLLAEPLKLSLTQAQREVAQHCCKHQLKTATWAMDRYVRLLIKEFEIDSLD